MKVVVPRAGLVVLCGPAGCGKSTFARRRFPETAIVSSDRLRAVIADDEAADHRVSRDAFELFHRIIDLRLAYGRLAVADSTALHPEARRTLRSIARRRGAPVTIFVFDVPEATCRAWNRARRRQVEEAVLHRQWLMLQEALRRIPQEGYDQVVVLDEAAVSAAEVEVAEPGERDPGSA